MLFVLFLSLLFWVRIACDLRVLLVYCLIWLCSLLFVFCIVVLVVVDCYFGVGFVLICFCLLVIWFALEVAGFVGVMLVLCLF